MYTRVESGVDINHSKDTQPRELDFAQKVQERFQLAFAEVYRRRGQGSSVPKIEVEPLFLPHADTPTDSERFRDQLIKHKGKIIVLEGKGWGEKDLNLLRRSAASEKDDKKVDKALKGISPEFRRDAEAIRGSKAAITIIDIPYSQIEDKLEENRKAWEYNPPYSGEFLDAVKYTKGFLSNVALHVSNREQGMLDQVNAEKVEELLKVYPSLTDLTTISFLLSLGSAHAPMPSDFANHSYLNEGIIRTKFDKPAGNPVDDELAAKVFLEYFIDQYLAGPKGCLLTDDSAKLERFKRIFVGQMNMKDAERIFNRVKRSVGRHGQPAQPIEELESLFSEKPRQMPYRENLDKFLAEPESAQPISA